MHFQLLIPTNLSNLIIFLILFKTLLGHRGVSIPAGRSTSKLHTHRHIRHEKVVRGNCERCVDERNYANEYDLKVQIFIQKHTSHDQLHTPAPGDEETAEFESKI